MITAVLVVYLRSCLNKIYKMPNHPGDLLSIIFQTMCHFASQCKFLLNFRTLISMIINVHRLVVQIQMNEFCKSNSQPNTI